MTKNEADRLLGYIGVPLMHKVIGIDNYKDYMAVYHTVTIGVAEGRYLESLLKDAGYNVKHILRRCVNW